MANLTDILKRIRARRSIQEELEGAKVGLEFIEAPPRPERIAMPLRFDFLAGKFRPRAPFVITGFPPPPGEQPDYILNNNGWMPTNYLMLDYFPEWGPIVPDLGEEAAAAVARGYDNYRIRWRVGH